MKNLEKECVMMEYNFSDSRTGLIKLIKEDLGWECGLKVDCRIGDHWLDLRTPISDLRIIIVGNLLFPDDINPESVKDPLTDPRGVKNRTIIFNYREEEIFEQMEQKKYPDICSLFEKLFYKLENNNPSFRDLYPEEGNEDDDYFENLDPANAEIFVDRLEAFIQELREIDREK